MTTHTTEVLTIDQLIAQLEDIRRRSPLGGGTCVYICTEELEYLPVQRTSLSDHESVEPCGVALLFSDPLDTVIRRLDQINPPNIERTEDAG